MSVVTIEQVLQALRAVEDPDLKRDIVSLGFVKDLQIHGGAVAFKIELTTPACPVKDLLQRQAEQVVAKIAGVEKVQIEMTAQVRTRTKEAQELVPGVRNIVAIASGKGGVGKSTVSANLAISLAKMGASVGLLDADIYGPSLPLMLGDSRRPPMIPSEAGPKIVPLMTYGIAHMSLGLLLEPDKAVAWRGPMVASAVRQLLGDVAWGELDYLLVDLPPGTGDAPMTLAQQVPLSGVVIVMTPQKVAQEIANKSILMFRMLEASLNRKIPLLGIVENMSGGVFGSGGGETAAKHLDVPFLGRIPLDTVISECGDGGKPIAAKFPDSDSAKAFRAIASTLAARLSVLRYEQGAG